MFHLFPKLNSKNSPSKADPTWVKYGLVSKRKPIILKGLTVAFVIYNGRTKNYSLFDLKNQFRFSSTKLYHVEKHIESQKHSLIEAAEGLKHKREAEQKLAEAHWQVTQADLLLSKVETLEQELTGRLKLLRKNQSVRNYQDKDRS